MNAAFESLMRRAEGLMAREHYQYKGTAAVMFMGYGVGMGLVIDGKTYHGSTGAAAEFGHMLLEHQETVHYLEDIVSLQRFTQDLKGYGKNSVIAVEKAFAKKVGSHCFSFLFISYCPALSLLPGSSE